MRYERCDFKIFCKVDCSRFEYTQISPRSNVGATEAKSRKTATFEPSAISHQFNTTPIGSLRRKYVMLCTLIAFQCYKILPTTDKPAQCTPAPMYTYIPKSRWVFQVKHRHLSALFSATVNPDALLEGG